MWKDNKKFEGRELPQKSFRSAPCTPVDKKTSPAREDSFHAVHKVPAGDSPYVRAKHVQLVERDPNKAISLFWAAINSGDRVDSALKDMAVVMKQMNRADEAIEAIKSFRRLCSQQAQEALDNVLLDLYKRCNKIDDQIELLQFKLRLIDEGLAFGGRKMKVARSQGKRFHLSIDQERARLLGNLAWAYIQQDNYQAAESLYRKALTIGPDKNKECNLALCLIQTGRIAEAKSILQGVKPPVDTNAPDSCHKSYERACEILAVFESHKERGKLETELQRTSSSPIDGITNLPDSANVNQNQRTGESRSASRCFDDSDEIIKTEINRISSSGSLDSVNENQTDGAQSFRSRSRWRGISDEEVKPETRRSSISIGKGKLTPSGEVPVDYNHGARSINGGKWPDENECRPAFSDKNMISTNVSDAEKWKKEAYSEEPLVSSPSKYINFDKKADSSTWAIWVDDNGVSEAFSYENIDSNVNTDSPVQKMKGFSQEIVGSPDSTTRKSQEQTSHSKLSCYGDRKRHTAVSSPASVNGDSKLTSQEPSSGSQYSANGSWRRNTGPSFSGKGSKWETCKYEKVITGNLNPNPQISSPIPEGISQIVPKQKVSGDLPASSNGNWDYRFKVSGRNCQRWADMVEEEKVVQFCVPFSVDKWAKGDSQDPVDFSSPKLNRAPSSAFCSGRRWSEMVVEDALTSRNLTSSAVVGFPIGSCRGPFEEQHTMVSDEKQKPVFVDKRSPDNLSFSKTTRAPSCLNSGRRWSDMVEEEEALASDNWNCGATIDTIKSNENQKAVNDILLSSAESCNWNCNATTGSPTRSWKNLSCEQNTAKTSGKQKSVNDILVSSTESAWTDNWTRGDAFSDENLDSNIMIKCSPRRLGRSLLGLHPQKNMLSENCTGALQQEKDEGQRTHSTDSPDTKIADQIKNLTVSPAGFKRNPSVRRSLCFDQKQKQKQEPADDNQALPKASNLEDYNCVQATEGGWNCGVETKPAKQRNRLRVFREIFPDSPRA